MESVLASCTTALHTACNAFVNASVMVVTFGTAWVYEYEGRIVANCHKLPSKAFSRRRISVSEIVDTWKPILSANRDKHWLFTVSPIRHLKDGLHENQLSKAVLLQAVDELVRMHGHASYFPSYEIMIDELRDYRFYAEDMVHPSELAVHYIWERFAETYMSQATHAEMKPLYALWLDEHHILLHPDSPEAEKFMAARSHKREELQKQYDWI